MKREKLKMCTSQYECTVEALRRIFFPARLGHYIYKYNVPSDANEQEVWQRKHYSISSDKLKGYVCPESCYVH
jgi:hypothetical protein